MKSDHVTTSAVADPAKLLVTLVATILFLSVAELGIAYAEQASPANQALRKAQGMLRQLASDKKALETKNAEMEAELAKKNVEISQILEEATQQQSIYVALQENNAVLVERIKSDYGKMQDIIAKYRAKQEELKLHQQDNDLLKNAVIERNEWISDCQKNNASLIAAGKDLLVRYNDKSVWDSIAGLEPVSGIGKVGQEIQNQEYRFKLEDLQVQPPDAGTAPLQIKKAEAPSQPNSSTEQSEK